MSIKLKNHQEYPAAVSIYTMPQKGLINIRGKVDAEGELTEDGKFKAANPKDLLTRLEQLDKDKEQPGVYWDSLLYNRVTKAKGKDAHKGSAGLELRLMTSFQKPQLQYVDPSKSAGKVTITVLDE